MGCTAEPLLKASANTLYSGETEYVPVPLQAILLLPMIEAGLAASPITVTNSVFDAPVPQALFAATEMVPELDPGVTVMVFVELLPDHPFGKVQV